ncbi:beta-ketoacyl-ACP synthase II [Terribacillus sp. DMT04]|uniref:beta-ketoacyl-ACP synthase II n=1 Tax=Terribacillus sp. DMT04 TaxID=2850441 RepID=UPI001C2C0B80|nr:beta-ketoacyl-ACP synthase II [Terribacillus sp. DMT04]QXE00674.1 beta-ketoacyl-ACP synthase II [Terribacillus sp. DMT04]
MNRRVVVTGYGAVTPLGSDVETFWNNIKAGKSGIKQLDAEKFAGIASQIGGTATGFEPEKYLDKKDIERYDLYSQFAYGAAVEAMEQANLNKETVNPERVGIYIGSGIGGVNTLLDNHEKLLDKGPRRVSPFMVPMMISNMATGIVSIKTGFTGPSFAPVSACATGNHAIGEAFLNIKHGYSDAMLAGGAEASITPFAYAGFTKMRAMSTQNDTPETASSPFDTNRDGFVMSEGAGILVLEELEHAQNRGAVILGEVVGYGSTTDAHHITSPNYLGPAKAMKLAMQMADWEADDVDYINAHATSTPEGDKTETKAIKEVFGDKAHDLLISATKSMTGHLFGAAGGVEAIITLKALQDGIVPPTINYRDADPECDLTYVPNESVSKDMTQALSNGFGFGGHNAVLALRKWKG